jgi:hypothetical protein
MPDPEGETSADEETVPETPLHAYKDEDRRDEVKGDVDALESGQDAQQRKIEDDDEPDLPKH